MFVINVSAEKMYIDDTQEISGVIVTLKNVASNSVIVQVGDSKGLVGRGKTGIINGFKVTVLDLFYVNEKMDRFADLSFSSEFICGDSSCDVGFETSNNCCVDCGCLQGMTCKNNKCGMFHLDECYSNKDCDDGNDETYDNCVGIPKKCINKIFLQCESNSDCEDDNDCTLDTCENNECFNVFEELCGFSEKEIDLSDNIQDIGQDLIGNVDNIKEESNFIKRLFSGILALFF